MALMTCNFTLKKATKNIINNKKLKMKKVIILSAIAIVVTVAVNAQADEAYVKNDMDMSNKQRPIERKQRREDRKELRKLNSEEVSNLSKEEFYSDFGDMPNTQWERSGNFDEVTFTKDEQVVTAFYDNNSKLVGTTSGRSFTDIPVAAQKLINEQYKDYSVADVIFFDDNEFNETDMVLFNQQFEDADNYFVELKKDNKKIVLEVNVEGEVSYFTRLK